MNARLIKNALYLFGIIAVLYLFELKFYLAWSIWWYDMVLHFLAGILVGIVAVLVFYRKDSRFFKIILSAIGSILFIGIAWEVYELYFGMTSFSDGMDYYIDTSSDLFLDIVGTLFGAWYGLTIVKKEIQK